MLEAVNKKPYLKMESKLLDQIMDIVVHMHTSGHEDRHYRVFVSEEDYTEIRASVHAFMEAPDTIKCELEPTDYQDGRCLYYCMGFKLLVELDKDREDGKPVIIRV